MLLAAFLLITNSPGVNNAGTVSATLPPAASFNAPVVPYFSIYLST